MLLGPGAAIDYGNNYKIRTHGEATKFNVMFTKPQGVLTTLDRI